MYRAVRVMSCTVYLIWYHCSWNYNCIHQKLLQWAKLNGWFMLYRFMLYKYSNKYSTAKVYSCFCKYGSRSKRCDGYEIQLRTFEKGIQNQTLPLSCYYPLLPKVCYYPKFFESWLTLASEIPVPWRSAKLRFDSCLTSSNVMWNSREQNHLVVLPSSTPLDRFVTNNTLHSADSDTLNIVLTIPFSCSNSSRTFHHAHHSSLITHITHIHHAHSWTGVHSPSLLQHLQHQIIQHLFALVILAEVSLTNV